MHPKDLESAAICMSFFIAHLVGSSYKIDYSEYTSLLRRILLLKLSC